MSGPERLVDLSAPIEASPEETPDFLATRIDYLDHAGGAAEVEALFGVPPRLLRDGEGWSRETITLGTHNSTHVDAPWHYNSRIRGEPAQTIEELPLELFFGPQDPALTVGSLAIRQTLRPPISANPVTTPSAPRPSASQLASSPSSANDSGSTSRLTRSRTPSLPCSAVFS